MRGKRARRVVPLRDEGGEINVADRGARHHIVRQGALEASDVIERKNEPPGRRRRAPRALSGPWLRFDPRRLALERVDRKLMVGRQRGMAGGQKLHAQVLEIEEPTRNASPIRASTGAALRCLPDEFDIALGGDQRIERVEQDADRGREPHPLSRLPRPLKQERARRLQLLGKRRLLANRRAIGRRQILVGIKDARDRAQVDGEFADRFARDHAGERWRR